MTSSPFDRAGRLQYAAEPMRHVEVHCFGRQLRNRRLATDRGHATKIETIAGYKFTLAFENARDRRDFAHPNGLAS